MKKSLVALAALALAGAASAQSSVTLFGVVDAAATYIQNTNTAGVKNSQWSLSNSGNASSRLGFRGTEDLGGGLAASFWLEAALGNDNGTVGASNSLSPAAGANVAQFFNRRSTVSLSGGFGEIRLGRDYTPTFWNDTIFDPFGTNGVGSNAIEQTIGSSILNSNPLLAAALGITGNGNYVRANNTIGYFLPSNLGGFYGQAMFGFSEKTQTDPGILTAPATFVGGKYVGGRVGYANGPLDVAVAYAQSDIASNFVFGGKANVNTGNVGASWDFGFLKLLGEYSQVDVKSDLIGPAGGFPLDVTYRGYLLGTTIPVGPGLIKLSYSHDDFDNSAVFGDKPKADKFAIGYVHNLSKRTALYATAAYTKNKDANGAFGVNNNYEGGQPGFPAGAPADKAYGYDFGIRHSF